MNLATAQERYDVREPFEPDMRWTDALRERISADAETLHDLWRERLPEDSDEVRSEYVHQQMSLAEAWLVLRNIPDTDQKLRPLLDAAKSAHSTREEVIDAEVTYRFEQRS